MGLMTESSPFSAEGIFILQTVYAVGARDDGPRARKYRGRFLDCVRAYSATLRPQAAGVGVECWKLGTDGTFERFPDSPGEDEAAPPPFDLGPMGEVENLGPVKPLG